MFWTLVFCYFFRCILVLDIAAIRCSWRMVSHLMPILFVTPHEGYRTCSGNGLLAIPHCTI